MRLRPHTRSGKYLMATHRNTRFPPPPPAPKHPGQLGHWTLSCVHCFENNTTFRKLRFHSQVKGLEGTYLAGADRTRYCQCLLVWYRHLDRAFCGIESCYITRQPVQTTATLDGSWPKVGANTPNNAKPLTSRCLLLDRCIFNTEYLNDSERKQIHLYYICSPTRYTVWS